MTSGISQFGLILAGARERRGMSLADLAGAIYVSRGWINNVEAGRRWPSRERVEQAERILQSGDDLLSEWERDAPPIWQRPTSSVIPMTWVSDCGAGSLQAMTLGSATSTNGSSFFEDHVQDDTLVTSHY